MQRLRIGVLLAACAASWRRRAPRFSRLLRDLWEWLNIGCRRVVDTYQNGQQRDLLVSGYAWHIAGDLDAGEARARRIPYAWGGGWARTRRATTNGDTDTVYFLVFSDSH